MKAVRFLTAIACVASVFGAVQPTQGFEGGILDHMAARRAASSSWQNGYYDPAWGMPVALVVPPTARHQVHYEWGAGGTGVSPIYHQFSGQPQWPTAYNIHAFRPAPPWPRCTEQMGDYYVRGPR
ncbi:MAG: hypothetical protein ABR915_03840 [Thermoguttaceae bacterium]|jgi:hypothetical protein